MKYVALLSGGKDSCYNLLHCSRNGHELVAAASLGPAHGKEELDSYLYQTVGQDAIEFVARALEVPLYRRVISGAAVEQGSEYGGRQAAQSGGVPGDETEDLYELLASVKEQLPDVQGVSVGAILSNYQRVRVEHVCRRLGLTSLCYLWQRDQAELLSEMIESGMEAILIKVAGIGLSVKHLGKTLAEMQPTLSRLNDLYGSHICGEGGEYETLTLDCPLFKHRITLREVETVIHSDSDFATVAYLRVKNAALEPKSGITLVTLTTPPLLSDKYQEICDAAQVLVSDQKFQNPVVQYAHVTKYSDQEIGPRSSRLGRWVTISNVFKTRGINSEVISIEEEVEGCFRQLEDLLRDHSLQLSNCVNVNIFLSSMDLFVRINTVYATFFGTSPPARACVAVDLPSPQRVRLECIAYAETDPSDRQALHVQGLSYWAPANIGPYSQAIVVDNRIFVSGQIGLVPSTLSLPSPQSLALETALSFQHADRIVQAVKSSAGRSWNEHQQGVIYWLSDLKNVQHVKKASQTLSKDSMSPVLFVVTQSLPKDALVEKQVLFHTGQCPILDEDNEIVYQSVTPSFNNLSNASGARIHWEMSSFSETSSTVASICFKGEDSDLACGLKTLPELAELWKGPMAIRLFHRAQSPSSYHHGLHILYGHSDQLPVTVVPCHSIATRDTESTWDYALFITR